jgi:protease PrsW
VSRVRTVVATELILLVGLLAFVAAAFLVERGAGIDDAVSLGAVPRVAFAAAPALLWLLYFRAQDIDEPEPRSFVFVLYLAGALVAGPVASFAVDLVLVPDVASAPDFDRFGAARLVTALLVVGVAQELTKYLVVRYTVYPLPDLGDPLDALVYATAVALGFATYRSHQYLSTLDGHVLLSVGAARVVVTTLAHACFSAVVGLAFGWAKFASRTPGRRALVLGAGLLAAVALNGLFAVVEGAIAITGLDFSPWRSIAFAFGFGVVVLMASSFLLRRVLRATVVEVQPG